MGILYHAILYFVHVLKYRSQLNNTYIPFFDFLGFRCIFQIALRVSSLNIIDP